jgi:protein-L-isoaspartate(D-aspartate) O-methyltransferase
MKPMTEKHFSILRRHMVEMIGIHTDLLEAEIGKTMIEPAVLQAMTRIPRHLFVPEPIAHLAYEDKPLPIGFGKTISQPFMCALMTDLLGPERHDTVLEVGTGLGYQTAILAELVGHIWSVEIVEEFSESAQLRLDAFGYTNIGFRVGDGSRGWVEHGPFEKIIVAAAAEDVPPALLEQLKPAGRLVMPLGPSDAQYLTVTDKDAGGGISRREIIPVRFTKLETAM